MSAAAASTALFNEQGYRNARYRAPTPDTAPSAMTVTTGQLQEIIRTRSPVLLDVQAVTVRPETEEFGFSWLPNETRLNLPGSVWLPNVGHGELDDRMERYFRDNLKRLTDGDANRALVVYCVLDCWMSWNAVKRAASYGYRQLYWYRGGTDEWSEAGLTLVPAEPVPVEEDPE